MSSRKRSKIKIALQIVAGLALLGLLLIAVGLGRQRWAAGQAMKTRERIEATLSAPDSYTPPLDAPIGAARVETFLAVRADLGSYCPAFTELTQRIAAVDARGTSFETRDEAPPPGELGQWLGELGSALKSFSGVALKLNRYGVDRNEALLRHAMGLGEFTFINIVACFSARGLTPGGLLGPQESPRVYKDRVAGQVREMIGRHAELLEGALERAPPEELASLRRRARLWRAEQEKLVADPARIAFADGLPPEIVEVLRPFEDRLERLCCPATSELDIARVVPAGKIWYDHR